MSACSKDLRLRVLAAVDQGALREEIARLFAVSLATIGHYVKRRRETGEVAARPSPGRTRHICSTAKERHGRCERSSKRVPRQRSKSAGICGRASAACGAR
jgi:transposase